jgi:hypothetical protein
MPKLSVVRFVAALLMVTGFVVDRAEPVSLHEPVPRVPVPVPRGTLPDVTDPLMNAEQVCERLPVAEIVSCVMALPALQALGEEPLYAVALCVPFAMTRSPLVSEPPIVAVVQTTVPSELMDATPSGSVQVPVTRAWTPPVAVLTLR